MLNKSKIAPNVRWLFGGLNTLKFSSDIRSNQRSLKNSKKNYLKAAILLLYGLIQILYLYITQTKTGINLKQYNHYVIKADEDHMHQNYHRFVNSDGSQPFIYLEVFNKKNFTSIKKISKYKLLKSFYKNYCIYKQNSDFINSKLNQLVFSKGLKSIAIYSYWCCLFKEISAENKNAVLFSFSPFSLAGYAATCNSMKTIYLAHGLVAKFISIPAYSEAYVYSKEDQTELINYLGHKKIDLYPIACIKNITKHIVVFLGANDSRMTFQDLSDLINFFKKRDFIIIVKTHPANAYSDILNDLSKINHIDKIIRDRQNAIQAINKYQPQFTVGWSSTGLCESLRAGVIPICLSKKANHVVDIAIYPIIRRSISWYDEKDLIDTTLKNPANHRATLNLLESR